jgi:diphthine-ammonia ligase
VIHSDDAFAQVAYLKFKKLSIVEKTQDEMNMDSVVIQDWKDWDRYDDIISAINNASETTTLTPKALPTASQVDTDISYAAENQAPFFAISGTTAFDNDPSLTFASIEDETVACMKAVEAKLAIHNLTWSDVVTMNVFVRNMDDFGRINAIYKTFFDINPSPRALVGAPLKGNAQLQIDAIAIQSLEGVKRETMHVQGISYWAPANIGPYSQSVVTQGHAFIAGQIGLIPNTLELPSPPSFADEAALSLRNLETIVSVLDMSLASNTACCSCFVSDKQYLALAKAAWETYHHGDVPPTLYVAVPALPRGAMVEWQVVLDAPVPVIVDEDENTTDDEQDRDTLNKLRAMKLNVPTGKNKRELQKLGMVTVV